MLSNEFSPLTKEEKERKFNSTHNNYKLQNSLTIKTENIERARTRLPLVAFFSLALETRRLDDFSNLCTSFSDFNEMRLLYVLAINFHSNEYTHTKNANDFTASMTTRYQTRLVYFISHYYTFQLAIESIHTLSGSHCRLSSQCVGIFSIFFAAIILFLDRGFFRSSFVRNCYDYSNTALSSFHGLELEKCVDLVSTKECTPQTCNEMVAFCTSLNDDKHRMKRHKLQHQTKNYSILIRSSFHLRRVT